MVLLAPGLSRLSRRTGSFVSLSLHLPDGFICLPLSPVIWPRLSPSLDACHGSLGWRGSFVSLCLPSFVSRCLPAWMPGTALWVDGFICHPLSPFICLPFVASQPGCLARLSGWTGSCLPSFVWHGSLGFVSLHLSPVVSQPGCLARLSRRTDSLVSLCLPSFVSRCLPARLFGWTVSLVSLCLPSFGSPCLPAWMSVTALQADGFTCLPWFPFICLPSLWVDGLICLPLSPFICLRCLPAWMPLWVDGFICLPLSPVVSQPGCPSGWTDSFVSRCLPAWMCGTRAPRFPSLPTVLSFWRGLVCLWLRPWLRSFLVLWMSGTGSSVCPSSGLRFCLGSWWVVFLVYRWLHPVCSFSASSSVAASLCPCSHLESRADESGALRCAASATRRLC